MRATSAGLFPRLAAWVCACVLAVMASGCAGAQPETSAPPPVLSAPPTVLPTATAPQPAPTAVRPTPLPSPTPLPPTPTALPLPTPTPVAALPLRLTAELDPPTPRAETEFVLRLTIANDGDRPAHGVYIATSGPWERWTVLAVQPRGTFARDAAGWHISSAIDISPRQSRELEVRIRADAASEDQLTFAVREAEPGELN